MKLICRAWVESFNARDYGQAKTYRSCQKYESLLLHDPPFTCSHFLDFVYNKLKAKFMHMSKHTEHYRK